MDTKAIEKYSQEAREQLLKDMEQQLYVYALDDAGRAEYGPDADAIRGVVLSPAEHAQRTELFRRIEREGALSFVTTMAYTWFNRFAAIRYMELAGYLPSHVRMLSAADGAFNPECLRVATTLDLPGLDQAEVMRLIQAGDDEKLYRHILLAQCNQLAAFLPSVFGTVAADALTLPQNLLAKTEFNVLYRLVTDIPEDAWRDVEILGWMYQFYNSEVKAEFFKSKRKAGAADIAPATQLFTPDWIVRYMVDNSLGRLWMLNHPESTLRDHASAEDPFDRLMEYYIEPDEEHEDFIRIASPEDITFCDPACGSGHILVYAFKMLMAIYEECGYREREAPELILTKNLAGFEIDERAAQIAQLALAMCARKHDRRFFTRNVTADICVLGDIDIDQNELNLMSPLRDRQGLLEELAHLGEIGSLLAPDADDIEALEGDVAESNTGDLFTSKVNENVERALKACKALRRRFDIVVANPPYMGSGSFNPFMSKWMKKRYPDSCKDLCTAFIERGYALACANGYAAMVTMQSWMFLGSFEKIRKRVIDEKTILTMAHLGPRAFDAIGGEVVSVTADVLYNGKAPIEGAYVRLVDIVGSEPKREKLLEAIQNPDCGWFYRADAEGFHDIPGSPISYWLNDIAHELTRTHSSLGSSLEFREGIHTADNSLFLRLWWEMSSGIIVTNANSTQDVDRTGKAVPYCKGGEYRKWYGNLDWVILFDSPHRTAMQELPGCVWPSKGLWFKEGGTWTAVSTGKLGVRYMPAHCLFDAGGQVLVGPNCIGAIGFLNTSLVMMYAEAMMPTLNFKCGIMRTLPDLRIEQYGSEALVEQLIQLSKADWDSQETAWDFKRNPLI